MRTSILGGVLVGALAVAIACGGRQKPSGAEQQNTRAEILALWTQIRSWRQEAKMGLEPAPQVVFQMRNQSVPQAKRVCPSGHQVTETCADVCNLADAICDNAEQICILADELGKDDDWAQEKCASAKASCREAKQNCCTKCSVSKAAW